MIPWLCASFGRVLELRRALCRYDARSGAFHRFKLPERRGSCIVCGTSPTITSLLNSATLCDEQALQGVAASGCGPACGPAGVLTAANDPHPSCTVHQYYSVRNSGSRHVLLDVRDTTQFDMCSLPGALNIPVILSLMYTFGGLYLESTLDFLLPTKFI